MVALATDAPSSQPAVASRGELRFGIGSRNRETGLFYDESRTVAALSVVMPEAVIPVGDWLDEVAVLVNVSTVGNAAAVALIAGGDAPWSMIAEVAYLDAAGNTVHQLTGYDIFLANLLLGYKFQTDMRKGPFFTTLTVGAGATAPTGNFLFRIPVTIIDREGIGAYPNGASNSASRIRITLAPLASTFSVVPNGTTTVRVRMIEKGFVIPNDISPAGNPYAKRPIGAGAFQQLTRISYDLTTGRRTIPHVRKGQSYRSLILVTRDATGLRSNAILNSLKFSIDEVPSANGPFDYLRHVTWERQNLLAATDLPDGVAQISYAHEWDGKVGGELRECWVLSAPGSKVEFEVDVAATGRLEVITNEIVADKDAAVLRI